MAQLLNFVVDIGILLNISVRRRHICLRLIIVVVGDKIFYRVLRKKLLEFAMQLGCQRLVMGNNKGRFLYLLDNICHGKGLA